jgi:hypothetical protein
MNVLQIHVKMAGHVMTLSMGMNVNVLLDITASTVTMVSCVFINFKQSMFKNILSLVEIL